MGTLTQDAADISSLLSDVQSAANDTSDQGVIDAVSALTSAMSAGLSSPSTLSQSDATNVGVKLRAAEQLAVPYPDYDTALQQLHYKVSTSLNNHYPTYWDDAAGNNSPTPNSGTKHPPQ